MISAPAVEGSTPFAVTNKQYNLKKRQACLSVFLFCVNLYTG
jgi:hypothetical protein